MGLNKRQIKLLKEAINYAKMENAVFMNDPLVSENLKFRIKNYTNTWIVGQLEVLLAEVTPKKKNIDDTPFGVSED